jgi:hypothetical protein
MVIQMKQHAVDNRNTDLWKTFAHKHWYGGFLLNASLHCLPFYWID